MPPSEFAASQEAPPLPVKRNRKPRKAPVELVDVVDLPDTIIELPAETIAPKPRRKRTVRTVDAAQSLECDLDPAPVSTQESELENPSSLPRQIDARDGAATESEPVSQSDILHEPDLESPAIDVRSANLNLPRVTTEVAALTRLMGSGRYALLPALGAEALLGLRLDNQIAKEADPYQALVVTGPWGEIELSDGVRLFAALTGIDLGQSAVEVPQSQWLSAAVLGRLDATPLRDITAIARGLLVSEQPCQTLRLSLRSGSHAFSLAARASSACWVDFLSRGGWQRDRTAVDDHLDTSVAVPVVIGCHALAKSVLEEVAVGDIILPDTCWFDCAGNGVILVGGWQLQVTYAAPAGLAIISLETRMDPINTTPGNADADLFVISPVLPVTAGASKLDVLPVQLQFEMGRCQTTLGALRTLTAGMVLPIEGGSPAVISITAGGRVMGRGELVDVNGQLGVRIVHWS
ncbi:type III secretion system cytoplasmic ring protein SctQ [Actimicrobium antarcticum]|uniref:Flagellar motor switch protein FliN-like C-terminal domain-containing protein n=1 Tax=Actimicrobium antarcticum TaxID=1051899 RepID=A0ABP7SUX9_9BURK